MAKADPKGTQTTAGARTVFVCSCEGTMPIDGALIARACPGARIERADHLCRVELERFRAALTGAPVTVACTQEAPLFGELAGEAPAAGPIDFVNIRETAGWSVDAAASGPKMAALLAAAAEPMPEPPLHSLTSEGVVLILGRDAAAIEAGTLLAPHLDVTVMLSDLRDVVPPRTTVFPVVQGRVRQASGHLGAFELTIDAYAPPAPSSRDTLRPGTARDGATSRCDVVLDLTGGAALFPPELRDGYLRADPGDPAAVLRAVLQARDLVGTFDKPRYVAFTDALCAHSRSRIVGCRRCLDLCPAGAIAPAGDHVAIDPGLCAGCGQCAAACPTGAAAYTVPPVDALLRKLRTLLLTYSAAGGDAAVLLLHDAAHGTPLIDALARFGDGLPATVLPLAINETTQIGVETIAAAVAYGAHAVRVLQRARPRHDPAGLIQTIALAEAILSGLGFEPGRAATIDTDDPDALGAALRAIAPPAAPAPAPSRFTPLGAKRGIQRMALRELQRVAPAPVDVVALPAGAPFGTLAVRTEGCTLCLACVSACPTGALSDDPDRPTLRFTEDACVQCGLCKATCPEKVIGLTPQLDLRPGAAEPRVLKTEDPFPCVRCGKPFGVKSTIERITAKLAGRHWMFQGADQRLEMLKMCEDCRVIVATEQDFDPHAAPRPAPRTTEDYLRERAAGPKKPDA